jgi:fatty-acyl-CoA synthase
LGAVWVPTNFRLMPDEVAYLATASGAKAFLCHGDFPDHAKAAPIPALEFIWRIGEGGFRREIRGRRDRRSCGRRGR